MSLRCHEEIGRVGRVGRRCYGDAIDLSATSRACRARGLWTGAQEKGRGPGPHFKVSYSWDLLLIWN